MTDKIITVIYGCIKHRFFIITVLSRHINTGADPGGGGCAPGARPPKIGKNMIFWRKIVFFHTKYPKIVRASLCNWKEYDFLV